MEHPSSFSTTVSRLLPEERPSCGHSSPLPGPDPRALTGLGNINISGRLAT